MILWILAFFLFMTEVMITLSIEKTEMNKQNFFIVFLMYFTYSQAWIVLVIWSLFTEIKHRLFKQEVKWYKRSDTIKIKAGDLFEKSDHIDNRPFAIDV
ncbi:putative glycosyltransferase YdaM [Bacillus velezensis]|nr:putative glycosyltransferase YdaM [Bacillus velezensis]